MNQFFRHSILAFSLLAIAFSGCKTAEVLSTKEVLLRFKPAKGDQYGMSMQMNLLMDGAQSMTMSMKMDNDLSIGEVGKDGAFYLENTVKKAGMNIKNSMMSIDYDSDNPDLSDPSIEEMHKTMGRMLNKSMVSKLNTRGEVLEYPDYHKIFGDDPEMTSQIQQMNQSLENTFIHYPENVLKVGDSWNADINIEGQAPMTQHLTYTVKEITATTVLLDVKGTIKFSPEAMMSGSGDFNGNITINRADGFLKTSVIKQNLNMSVQGMNMKTSTDINLSLTKRGK